MDHIIFIAIKLESQLKILVMGDREQAACQSAKSPPSGHSNSQSRAGHCGSPGGLLASTWPATSPNTPNVVTVQKL